MDCEASIKGIRIYSRSTSATALASIMQILVSVVSLSLLVAAFVSPGFAKGSQRCRNLPGDPGYPSQAEWDVLNATIDGRLVAVVPSAKFCHELPAGSCPSQQWESTLFRTSVPGAMINVRLWFLAAPTDDHLT